jgi:hypothetical protein
MTVIQDYNYWMEEKKALIDYLLEHESLIYQRLESIFTVLDAIERFDEITDEDLEVFQWGFQYLNEQFVTLEQMMDDLSIDQIDQQSVLFNYMMDLSDFYMDAVISEDIKKACEQYLILLQGLIMHQQPLSDYIYTQIESLYMEATESYVSIPQMFENYLTIEEEAE